jgi:GT2 family glycosyltransferase
LASFVFGANIAVVVLNQNCGFSYANNVGVAESSSRRIAIINPDVFPREPAAFAHMLRLADEGFGKDIVGGKLYYSDGSVMHEGMFFAPDQKLSALCRAPVWTVEHFRKGFADTASDEVRAVPALTGALMLLERQTFDSMGGFDGDFIYGHYEDADLCLRVRKAGGRALLDPRLAYWHYEGTGSVKRPEHAGSNLYNRWSFSRRWGGQLGGANDV